MTNPKTAEELAEEHADKAAGMESDVTDEDHHSIKWLEAKGDFLAGYQAGRPSWISVEDRLPDTINSSVTIEKYVTRFSYPVLVHIDDFGTLMGFYEINESLNVRHWFVDRVNTNEYLVTHWMPLPEPPTDTPQTR